MTLRVIPLFRTTEPELACNALVKRCARVIVQQHTDFNDNMRIRFRADMVKGANVYFDRVPSQLKSWQERGGVLLTNTRNDPKYRVFGPHDALVLAECVTRMSLLERAFTGTQTVGVIRERVNWESYETAIRTKRAYPPQKIERRVKMLYETRDFVNALPEFSPRALARILRAQESSRLSSVPELLVVSARYLDTPC